MSSCPMPERRLNRRRFLKISAASVAVSALGVIPAAATSQVHRWTGIALGAKAETNLVHEDAATAHALFKDIEAEVRRLENIFSLYQPDSELTRLNEAGILTAPSLDLLQLLAQARQLHDVTGGAFDPTAQSLWAYYAEGAYSPNLHKQALKRTGFSKVRFDTAQIEYSVPGMALTLNGIAQGYITDQVAKLLKSRGFGDVAVDLGELNLIGTAPESDSGWDVTLKPDATLGEVSEKQTLSNKAVASSAQTGTTFDEDGKISHILDPRTGQPVHSDLRAVSVIADNAAIADGLSTAALVLGEQGLANVLGHYQGTKAFAIRQNGKSTWLGSVNA